MHSKTLQKKAGRTPSLFALFLVVKFRSLILDEVFRGFQIIVTALNSKCRLAHANILDVFTLFE
jgi:hypothetical protein